MKHLHRVEAALLLPLAVLHVVLATRWTVGGLASELILLRSGEAID